MAIIITPDGTETEANPAKKKFTLEEIQSLVGGDIELVPCVLKSGKIGRMYVNESGRIDGLPYNKKATAMMTSQFRAAGNFICGTAAVMDKGEG